MKHTTILEEERRVRNQATGAIGEFAIVPNGYWQDRTKAAKTTRVIKVRSKSEGGTIAPNNTPTVGPINISVLVENFNLAEETDPALLSSIKAKQKSHVVAVTKPKESNSKCSCVIL